MATPRPKPPAPFGATVALSTTLAVAAFAVVMPVVMSAIPAVQLPYPLPEQHQRGETLVYLLAFAVLLPLGLVAGRRLCERIAGGPNAPALNALCAVLVAGLAAAVLAVKASGRLSERDGVGVVLVAAAVWWLVAGVLLARAARAQAWGPLTAAASRGPAA